MLVAAAAVVVELVVDESVTGSGVVALSEIGSHHASVVLEPSGLEVLVSVSAVGRTLEVDLRAREGEAEEGGEGGEGEECFCGKCLTGVFVSVFCNTRGEWNSGITRSVFYTTPH